MVCLILGTMISWQYASVKNNRDADSLQNKRLDELRDELLLTKNNYDALAKRNEELLREKQKYESMSGNITKETQALTDELVRARMVAGLISVKGKGVVVTLDDGDSEPVTDSDILNVLNELRASDAQAISINDERVVAMTEVRYAGGYIMVNSKQMLAPFTIKAISDPDKLENALRMVAGVIESLEVYGIKVSVQESNDIEIPRVKDDGSVIRTDMLIPVNS